MIIALQTLVFFRESLLTALDRLLRPYYKHLTLAFSRSGNILEDEEVDDQVFAEYDEDKGVVFYPPMYSQRYAAVSDCLMDDRWCGQIEKVVDFGHHDMSFIKYLKEVPGIRCILGVDIETIPLRCSSDLLGGDEYAPKRENPLQVTLFQGNAADPDYRLIGCDAVIAIEMIEHMLPHDLDRLVHTVFGFIKPKIVIFTTPNSDFNVLFKALGKNGLRRWDHLFEWSREQFNDWCSNIVVRYPNYAVTCRGIGPGPPGTLHHGCCSQLSLFVSKDYHKQADLNLNSLAVVTTAPSPNNYSEVFEGWESSVGTRNEMDHATNTQAPLNCTTLQVKKFSKTTQNLMAKNRIDSLIHTREVVNEIRHLTKTLNFNKFSQPEDGNHVWCNINWGDNAPYWNQYYKIVREYIYPFETKSEEGRILDLISEEIHRLIDTQCDDEYAVDINRLEIPLTNLMGVVQHITNDVERVRDLLEWNGYEIVNDVVIHSRLVVDTTSVVTHDDDWQDNDTLSDWDTTEYHSTSMSEGSAVVPDVPGRCLRRALDHKVRNLRSMLSADEDITTELDRVVCRLMKLALQSSQGRQSPPPTRWMQCKLLDLLTLTEKAIGRRKKNSIQNYPFKTIELEFKNQEAVVGQDDRVKEIVQKYRHLIQPLEKTTNTEDTNGHMTDMDVEDEFMSTTSNEFMKDYEFVEGMSPSLVIPQPVFSTETFEPAESPSNENPLERTKAWLDEDVEVAPYTKVDMNYENISSGDTDHSVSKAKHKLKKTSKKHKLSNKNIQEVDTDPPKTTLASKSSQKFKIRREDRNKKKNSNTKITKKVPKKKPSNILSKKTGSLYTSADCDDHAFGSNDMVYFNKSTSKPIPESLKELCHSELKTEKDVKPLLVSNNVETNIEISDFPSCEISATKESFLVDIITQDYEETIALRRTIGTDAEVSDIIINKVEDSSDDFGEKLCTKHEVSTENVQSQTIFLNDINEPSTSKGIRHNISADVQCGPDTLVTYPTLSTSTTSVKMPHVHSTGIKIYDVGANTKVTGTDFGTSMQDCNNITTITPRQRSVGIKIKDSDINLSSRTECSTMTMPGCVSQTSETVTHIPQTCIYTVNSAVTSPETKLIKPISSSLKLEDSITEFCGPSNASSLKTLSYFMNASKNTSGGVMEPADNTKVVVEKHSTSKYVQSRLCCGGVHIHSYKDKQDSEDIVYQGEWQRYRPKGLARKKTYNTASLKKSNDVVIRKLKENLKEKKVNSKEKVLGKKQEKNQIEERSKKFMLGRNDKLSKLNQEDNKYKMKTPVVSRSYGKISNNIKRIPRPIKTVTKVASKNAMSATSKNAKSTFTVKRPAILPNAAGKKDNNITQKLKKSYIPLYLKRTLQSSTTDKDKLNKSLDSATDIMKRRGTDNKTAPLVRSKTEDIGKDLLNFSDDVRENISYIVFRNDLEDDIELRDDQTSGNSKEHNKSTTRQIEIYKRSHSPQSLNSSTCSSPNSIATVRAATTRPKNGSNRRHSISSYKNNLTNSESDNPSPTKTKKTVKRSKTAKKVENKDIDNKENIPESTKNINKDKMSKSPFNRPKSVCIAQMKNESSSSDKTLSRHKVQISNKSKISPKRDSDELRRTHSPTISKKRSLKSDTSSMFDDLYYSQSESFDSSDSTNMVLVLEPQPNYDGFSEAHVISNLRSTDCAMKSDHSEYLQNLSLHSQASHILHSMRQILEETLDLIVSPSGHNMHPIDSETGILSREEIPKSHVDGVTSPDSKFDVNDAEIFNSTFLENDIENALNRTFDSILSNESTASLNDTRLNVTDFESLSFKSITSVPKNSDYYLADNEFDTSLGMNHNIQAHDINSVQDIFERREQCLVQNIPGTLAVQAFSGFSFDVDGVAGDQPDPVALIDSETGSLGVDMTRLATSEELFISGRSSDSYESCLIDEDAVVPNWLFQLISQQQSVEEEPEPREVLIGPVPPPPPDEPVYDANGNIIEPSMIGVGAGAGDGRGIHSDHSQDSSGRGTSLSSSDTSSGIQSEAIIIDPSTFTTQMELLRDPMASSAAVSVDHHHPLDHSYRIDDDAGTLVGSREDRMRTINASDVDADISSIDTDVPDSSDN